MRFILKIVSVFVCAMLMLANPLSATGLTCPSGYKAVCQRIVSSSSSSSTGINGGASSSSGAAGSTSTGGSANCPSIAAGQVFCNGVLITQNIKGQANAFECVWGTNGQAAIQTRTADTTQTPNSGTTLFTIDTTSCPGVYQSIATASLDGQYDFINVVISGVTQNFQLAADGYGIEVNY